MNEPFQVFRFRLVDVFDEVIERAEKDAEFRFTLDNGAGVTVPD